MNSYCLMVPATEDPVTYVCTYMQNRALSSLRVLHSFPQILVTSQL